MDKNIITYTSMCMKFKVFGEHIPNDVKGFLEFSELNILIERIGVSFNDILSIYHEVLLGNDVLISDSQIHGEVWKLVYNTGLPVNRILGFLDHKFQNLEDMMLTIAARKEMEEVYFWPHLNLFRDLGFTGKISSHIVGDNGRLEDVSARLSERDTLEQRFLLFYDFIASIHDDYAGKTMCFSVSSK